MSHDEPGRPAPARVLDRSSALPLWAQVRADLLVRIQDGEFEHAFPGEWSLSQEYAVSRHTIRQALQQLRQDGTLLAERGRPPRVSGTATIQQPLGALYSLYASVEAAGLTQHSLVRRLEVLTDAGVAAVLGLPEQAPLLHLERVRLAGDAPLAHDHAWLPAVLTRALLEADFTHTALYTELATRCGIRLTGGSEEIRAIIPSREERRLLRAPSGAAVLAIERIGCHQGSPVELRRTLVRGDRFVISAQFSHANGYRMNPATALNSPPATRRRTRPATSSPRTTPSESGTP